MSWFVIPVAGTNLNCLLWVLIHIVFSLFGINSFIVSKHSNGHKCSGLFPGKLGVKQEYTLDGMPAKQQCNVQTINTNIHLNVAEKPVYFGMAYNRENPCHVGNKSSSSLKKMFPFALVISKCSHEMPDGFKSHESLCLIKQKIRKSRMICSSHEQL